MMTESESEREARQGKRADAHFNGDFYCIQTYSGRGMTGFDSRGAQHLLPPDADDEAIGKAVLDALSLSRFLSMEENKVFRDLKRITQAYAEWTQSLMKQYGYKTKRSLFQNMANCGIKKVGNTITMSPTSHEKLEGWGRTKGDGIEDVVVPADADAAAIGAALKLAFSRCL